MERKKLEDVSKRLGLLLVKLNLNELSTTIVDKLLGITQGTQDAPRSRAARALPGAALPCAQRRRATLTLTRRPTRRAPPRVGARARRCSRRGTQPCPLAITARPLPFTLS